MQFEHIGKLMDMYHTRSLAELARCFYDDTECGVNVSFLTPSETIYPADLHPIQDRLEWAIRNIVGIEFGTIVEGSDAEMTCKPLFFPLEQKEIDDTLTELESFAEEN